MKNRPPRTKRAQCIASFLSIIIIMSIIKNNVLYPFDATPNPSAPKIKTNAAELIFSLADKIIEGRGDFDWLINGGLEVTGETKTGGKARRKLSEIEPDTRRIAKAFYKRGLRKGDVVHILLPNSCDFHVTLFGIWMCGGVASLSDPGISVKNLTKQLEDTEAKLIVCFEGSQMQTVRQTLDENDHLLSNVQVLVVQRDQGEETCFRSFHDFVHDSKDEPDPPSCPGGQPITDDDLWVILWSSGTTGSPKGIQHTYSYFRKILADFIRTKRDIPIGGTTVVTTCFFHVSGFLAPLNALVVRYTFVFFCGEDLEQNPDLSSSELLFKSVDLYRPGFVIGGTHHVSRLAKEQAMDGLYNLASVTGIMPTGSTVPKNLFTDLKRNFKTLWYTLNFYGLTEIGNAITMSFDTSKLGGVAKGSVVKIVDPETKEKCGPNKVGEIWVNTDVMMKGYLKRPEEDQLFFSPDGFARTGDLGHYDLDGVVYFDGRFKDLIKYNNIHVHPMEIESVISKIVGVQDVAVFGKPDPSVQELVTAAVVLDPESEATEDDIVQRVEHELEDAKHLRGGVIFLDRLPRNPQGKVLRRELI